MLIFTHGSLINRRFERSGSCDLVQPSLQLVEIALCERIRVYVAGDAGLAEFRRVDGVAGALGQFVCHTVDEAGIGGHIAGFFHCCEVPVFKCHDDLSFPFFMVIPCRFSTVLSIIHHFALKC